MVIEFTQGYKLNDTSARTWAMQVVRNQVLKQLVTLASPNWSYTMRFEELHTLMGTVIQYTFRIILDEQPL